MMQTKALAALYQEYDKSAAAIEEKKKQLEVYRNDYKALKARLKTLPDKLQHDALLPLGSKALVPGKIVHTNEVMCMLGDNWFMECTAKTAAEIVDRRIKKCNQHIQEQIQEKERLENWRSTITKLILESAEEDTMEIAEEVSIEDYEKMMQQHRENVRKHQRNLAEEKAKIPKEQEEEEMRRFWERLEELELEEELLEEQETYKARLTKEAAAKRSQPGTSKTIQSVSPSFATSRTNTSQINTVKSISESMSAASSSNLPCSSKSILKSASTSDESVKKVEEKKVLFSEVPEVNEIPRSGSPELESTEADDLLDAIAPTLSVEGVKETVIERINSSGDPTHSSSIAKASTTAQPGVEDAPKRVSLFKQRRGR